MKISILLSLFSLLPNFAFAESVCDLAWKSKTSEHPKVLCRLEWGRGQDARGLEWVSFKKKCGQEGEPLQDCAQVRECHPARKSTGDIGIGVIRKGSAATLCIGMDQKKRVALLERPLSQGRADLICDSRSNPVSVVLEGPANAQKVCAFPHDLR